MPLSRSLAYLKRETSEKKRAEARQGWRPGLQEEIQDTQQEEAAGRRVTGSSKSLASRFYQKTDHCLTGRYQHYEDPTHSSVPHSYPLHQS